MNINILLALLSLGLILSASFTNAYKIIKHKTEPTISSWLIFLSASVMSFLSYLASTNRDFVGGMLNGADILGDVTIVFVTAFFGMNKWTLKSFEKFYLAGLVLIGIFWILTSNAFRSNLLLQGMLVFAYIPTIHAILKYKINTESFVVWGLILFASLVSIYPSLVALDIGNGYLSLVYSLRSVVCVSVLLAIMFVYRKAQVTT